jgi:hypothetical protein
MNAWQYGIRIDGLPRCLSGLFLEKFPDCDYYDPRKELEAIGDAAAAERLRSKWPDVDAGLLYIPIVPGFDRSSLLELLKENPMLQDRVEFIAGLAMESDSEFSEMPKYIVGLLCDLRCAVVVNVTFMGEYGSGQ